MSESVPTRPCLETTQRRALSWAALLASAAVVYVIEPVAIGMFLGALLAFMSAPLHGRLLKRFGKNVAAILTTVIVAHVVVITLAGLLWELGSQGTLHARELAENVTAKDGLLSQLKGVASRLGMASNFDYGEKAIGWIESEAAKFAAAGAAMLGVTASVLLLLFFMVLTLHFVLRNSTSLVTAATQTLPLKPEWTLELFRDFRRVGRATLFGTLVTGLAQGVLATIAYAIAGVPDPIFYGVATAVASLVPAIGTLLVWVPIGIVMIATGHPVAGVFILVWGAAVVVGVSDYVIRPRLVGDEEMPSLLTFAALFGGVEAMGLKGLIVGPVVLSLGFSVLRLYKRERAHVASSAPHESTLIVTDAPPPA
ncbi:MAG: AI-2E family transporter [Archangium sp.]